MARAWSRASRQAGGPRSIVGKLLRTKSGNPGRRDPAIVRAHAILCSRNKDRSVPMSHVLESLTSNVVQGGGSIALSDERRTYTYAALLAEIGPVAGLLCEALPGDGPVALVAD